MLKKIVPRIHKIKIKNLNFGQEISLCCYNEVKCIKSACGCTRKFQIFLVRMHSGDIIHHFVPCCKKSKHMMYFLSMSNIRSAHCAIHLTLAVELIGHSPYTTKVSTRLSIVMEDTGLLKLMGVCTLCYFQHTVGGHYMLTPNQTKSIYILLWTI